MLSLRKIEQRLAVAIVFTFLAVAFMKPVFAQAYIEQDAWSEDGTAYAYAKGWCHGGPGWIYFYKAYNYGKLSENATLYAARIICHGFGGPGPGYYKILPLYYAGQEGGVPTYDIKVWFIKTQTIADQSNPDSIATVTIYYGNAG